MKLELFDKLCFSCKNQFSCRAFKQINRVLSTSVRLHWKIKRENLLEHWHSFCWAFKCAVEPIENYKTWFDNLRVWQSFPISAFSWQKEAFVLIFRSNKNCLSYILVFTFSSNGELATYIQTNNAKDSLMTVKFQTPNFRSIYQNFNFGHKNRRIDEKWLAAFGHFLFRQYSALQNWTFLADNSKSKHLFGIKPKSTQQNWTE